MTTPISFLANIPGAWWFGLAGALVGGVRGSVLGAIVGWIVGIWIGRWVTGLFGAGATQGAFYRTLFRALGHLSKVDGRVNEVEISAVESLMAQMGISGRQRRAAIEHFRAGKEEGFDIEADLAEFRSHTRFRPDLRFMFLDILIQLAAVDGTPSAAERGVLQRIAARLQISNADFERMVAAHAPAAAGGGQRQAAGARRGSLQQAYATLGVESSASDADIKRAYRRLMAQYHPDRLIARGLPDEMMEMAKTRVRDINAAYDVIKKQRPLK